MNITIDFYKALELCSRDKPDFVTYRQWNSFKRSVMGEWGRRHRLQALRAEQAESRTTTRPEGKSQFKPYILAA